MTVAAARRLALAAAAVVAATTTALGAAVGLGGSPRAAAATPQPVFGVRPAAEGRTPLPGGHFSYSVPAGSTITDAVVVENLTARPLPLRVFAADLIALRGGGFSVTQLGQPTDGVGSWTTVAVPSPTVAPGGQVTVGFTVHVPRDALSGDYGGAVVTQNAPSPGQGLAVQFRVALQVRIHVTGQDPRLAATLTSLTVKRSGRSELIATTLTNTGNESFQFDGAVHLRTGSGRRLTLGLSPRSDYLFPGQHVTLAARWLRTPVWGSAHLDATVVAQPPKGAPATFRTRPAALHFFPWWLVLMAAAALLLLITAVVQAWRNRRDLRRRALLVWRRHQAVRRFKGQLDATLAD